MRPYNYKKQQMILDYLKERAELGIPPTVREICAATNTSSTSTIQMYLDRMVANGLIDRSDGKNRSVRLKNLSPSTQVPIIGKITAGVPILAVEDVLGTIPFPIQNNSRELFALKVQGDSMINAGILDGDYIVAENNTSPENGDIVVALIDDEATVKRFIREKDGNTRLQPENPKYEPIIGSNIGIIGKVISVIRYYHR